MKNLKVAIIICIIFIMILLLFLFITLNKEQTNTINIVTNNNIENSIQTEEIIEDDDILIKEDLINNKLKYVDTRIEYYKIKDVYDKYIGLAGENDAERLVNLFDEKYIVNHKLSIENIVKFTGIKAISNSSQLGSYTSIIDYIMTAEISQNQKVYFIKGKYLLKATGSINNLILMIVVDESNSLYNVYPYTYMQEKGYDKLNIGNKLENISVQINDRKQNKLKISQINDSKIVKDLMNDWSNRCIYDTQSAYKMININYANSKFSGDYNKFKKHINNMKYIPKINQYKIYSTNDYTDYICTDQYNNYYIFRQQGGIMRYTVFLDNYTVELDTFKKNYEKADENTKIAIQIGKFKQMLNSKDCNAIYSKLNSTFKKNNYSTVAKLESYLSKNTYDINTIVIEEHSKNKDYYVCKCILQNQKNTNEQKNMTIIIKLIDSNNFEMSFSFNE